MKKRMIAALAAILMASIALASLASDDDVSKPTPGIEKITGTVTEVRPQNNSDGTASTTKAYILIKSKDSGLTIFYVNANGCSIRGGSLSDIKVGSRVTGTYDASRPVVMVNPPQFTATSITLH